MKEGKKKSKGLWYNVNKRKEKGLPPKKKGQKGYPSSTAWKKLTSEGVESLRELIRETLAVGVRELDPLSSGGWTSPEHEEWLASLEDEHAELDGDPVEIPQRVGETSGGADRPLHNIK
jgi:hypothetical protein